MNIIETKGLTRYFGAVKAVENLSIKVREGEIYAFLGLNGAGKSTSIRMMLGMLRPSRGTATVLGLPVKMGAKSPWGEVGYLMEQTNAYPELSVRDNLEIARRLHPGIESQAADEMIDQLGLTRYGDRRADQLSLGNKQRLGLAKALLHRPRLLMLDEPANGLDPAGIVEIRQLLLDLVDRLQVTVFISSHILGEVSRLAQRIGIIHEGRLLKELSADDLHNSRRRWLDLSTKDNRQAMNLLKNSRFAGKMTLNGCLRLESGLAIDHPDELASYLVGQQLAPKHLAVGQENLEDYFLRLVGIPGEQAHD